MRKSTAVKNPAKKFGFFIEVNFESDKETRKNSENANLHPKQLCEKIRSLYDTPIIVGKTLLFFDEIQACIPAIEFLRFFTKKMPELHVIAAGSLLEFTLEEIQSFGVGRVGDSHNAHFGKRVATRLGNQSEIPQNAFA